MYINIVVYIVDIHIYTVYIYKLLYILLYIYTYIILVPQILTIIYNILYMYIYDWTFRFGMAWMLPAKFAGKLLPFSWVQPPHLPVLRSAPCGAAVAVHRSPPAVAPPVAAPSRPGEFTFTLELRPPLFKKPSPLHFHCNFQNQPLYPHLSNWRPQKGCPPRLPARQRSLRHQTSQPLLAKARTNQSSLCHTWLLASRQLEARWRAHLATLAGTAVRLLYLESAATLQAASPI